MGDNKPAADDARRGSPGSDPEPSEHPSRAAGSLVLYVHERSDGIRVLIGGGVTDDGICADVFATLHPGGTWNGVAYDDLPPGRYDIVEGSLVRANGTVVLSGG